MCQKQRERAGTNRAESKESNKPKTLSAEQMRKSWECCKAETSGVASEPGVASTSKAAQAMDIDTDSKQSTQSQMESTQHSTRSLCNSHNSTFVIHSVIFVINVFWYITLTFLFTFLHASRCFHAKKASVVSLKYYPPHFFSLLLSVQHCRSAVVSFIQTCK
jgi:hypothetical protein